MLRILTLITAVPLLVVNSDTIPDYRSIQTINDFAKEIVDAEKEYLQSIPDDKATAINQTLERFKSAAQKIKKSEENTKMGVNFYVLMHSILRDVPEDDVAVTELAKTDVYLRTLIVIYEVYESRSSGTVEINEKTIKRMSEIATSANEEDVPSVLSKLYNQVVGTGSSGGILSVLQLIGDKLENLPVWDLCGGLSLQLKLYEIYLEIAIAQLKGFAVFVFGHTLEQIFQNVSAEPFLEPALAQVVLSTAEYMLAAKEAMKGVSRQVNPCEAEEKTRDTYTDMNGFMQAIIINEVDANPDRKCNYDCGGIEGKRQEGCWDSSQYCPRDSCKGWLSGCWTTDDTQLCEAPEDSGKRYDWFQSTSGHVHGVKTSCPSGVKYAHRWSSWWWCNVCACICTESDRDSEARRTISFIPQQSDIKENMVVTGIRFSDQDNILQIQIKQGKLLPNGFIDEDTIAWKELTPLKYNAETVSGGEFLLENEEYGSSSLTKDKDYIMLSEGRRDVYLDDINLPDGYVLTGVRLNNNLAKNGPQIEAMGTKFDYDTGELGEDSVWVTPKEMKENPELSKRYQEERYFTKVVNSQDPLKVRKNDEMLGPNGYTAFGPSSWTHDAAQSTVPFIDIQAAETIPTMPLAGVGLFLRRAEDYGGFLTLRAISLDLSKVWKVKIDDNLVKQYAEEFPDSLPYDLSDE